MPVLNEDNKQRSLRVDADGRLLVSCDGCSGGGGGGDFDVDADYATTGTWSFAGTPDDPVSLANLVVTSPYLDFEGVTDIVMLTATTEQTTAGPDAGIMLVGNLLQIGNDGQPAITIFDNNTVDKIGADAAINFTAGPTGKVNFAGAKLAQVADPENPDEVATKGYVDANAGGSPGGAVTNVQFNDGTSFAGDSGFTYDATPQNVGIGRAPMSGSTKLALQGSGSTRMHLRGPNTTSTGAAVTGSAASDTASWGVGEYGNLRGGTINGNVALWSAAGSAVVASGSTDIASFHPNGNVAVGIATATMPSNTIGLHVNNANASGGAGLHLTGVGSGTTSSDGFVASINASNVVSLLNYENASMQFGTNGSTRMTVAANGDVGIGGAPSVPLHVMATTGGAALYLDGLTTPTAGQRIGLFGSGAASDQGKARVSFFAAANWTAGSDTPTYATIMTTPAGSATPAERVRVDAAGNVGIGVAPSYNLHVSSAVGTVARVASTTANEVSVDLSNSTETFKMRVSSGGTFSLYNNTAAANMLTAGGSANGGVGITALGTGGFSVTTAGTQRMRINNLGQVETLLPTAEQSLTVNNSMTVTKVSDTALKFSVRGADGVTRSATLTLA